MKKPRFEFKIDNDAELPTTTAHVLDFTSQKKLGEIFYLDKRHGYIFKPGPHAFDVEQMRQLLVQMLNMNKLVRVKRVLA